MPSLLYLQKFIIFIMFTIKNSKKEKIKKKKKKQESSKISLPKDNHSLAYIYCYSFPNAHMKLKYILFYMIGSCLLKTCFSTQESIMEIFLNP